MQLHVGHIKTLRTQKVHTYHKIKLFAEEFFSELNKIQSQLQLFGATHSKFF